MWSLRLAKPIACVRRHDGAPLSHRFNFPDYTRDGSVLNSCVSQSSPDITESYDVHSMRFLTRSVSIRRPEVRVSFRMKIIRKFLRSSLSRKLPSGNSAEAVKTGLRIANIANASWSNSMSLISDLKFGNTEEFVSRESATGTPLYLPTGGRD